MQSPNRHPLPMGAPSYAQTDVSDVLRLIRMSEGLELDELGEAPDLYVCLRCGTLGPDPDRCLSCGEHRP